jgi:hypothetical protein
MADLMLPLADTTTRAEGPRWPPEVLHPLLGVVAALPLVIFGIADMAKGWRPLFDNAAIALRSYQVFSGNSPLVGHQVAVYVGSQPVYSPGPLENWLLALPVRLDPGQGALWGAVIFALVGVMLAIEAAWSAARWWGALIVTTSVLLLFAVRGDVAVDVMWNPWFGIVWLYTTLASSWATAAGRLRWWPVAVISASIVAQCHEVFALPAIEVSLTAAVVGVIVCRSRHRRVNLGWLAVGTTCGLVAWIAPVVQQLTNHPGNLTLLWRVAHQGGTKIGLSQALGALGGASRLVPKWVNAPPHHGALSSFGYIANGFVGSQWWAVTALVLLAAITVVAFVTGRHLLSSAAALSFVVAAGTVRAIATVPAAQFLDFGYLNVLLIPVGTAVWVTIAWTLVELARPVIGPVITRRVPSCRERINAAAGHLVMLGGATMLAATLGWSLASGLDLLGTSSPTIGGWTAVQAADTGLSATARLAPRTPFRLELAEPSNDYRFSVLTGVAYLLNTEGFQPRLMGIAAATFGESRPNMPVVLLHIPTRGDRVWASVARNAVS